MTTQKQQQSSSSSTSSLNSNSLCFASSSYLKQSGNLSLNERALTWSTASSSTTTTSTSTSVNKTGLSNSNDLLIATSKMSGLFCSKEGRPKVQIKISVYPLNNLPTTTTPNVEESYLFTFTNSSTAISDREHFKTELSAMIQSNRIRKEREALEEILPVKSSIQLNSTLKGKEREVIGGSNSNGEDIASKRIKYKREILSTNSNLAELHRTLVLGAMISEEEFWEGREELINELTNKYEQIQGSSGKMVDPKPVQGEGSDYTVKITKELMKDIFEEYPNVLQAFDDNVPSPLNVHEFWTRYFQSKLFNRNRTTNRNAVNTIKDDAIFDRYLGEEDDDIEPKNLKHQEIYRLLDLAATEDDQHEVTNQPDLTMRAGGERASLPLMRRFNEHSERLLNQSLGQTNSHNRMALDPGHAGNKNSYYNDIILEDLNEIKFNDRIVLNIHQPVSTSTTTTTKSGGGGGGGEGMEGIIEGEEDELGRIIELTKREFRDWDPRLGEFEPNQEAMNDAVEDMMISIKERAERSSRDHNKNTISPNLLSEIITLQTSTNEFLRQFYSAILPPKLNDLSTSSSTSTSTTVLVTPNMRAAKVERMKGCLEKGEERILFLLIRLEEQERGGEGGEEEKDRVEAALKPCREAVVVAIEFYNSRISGGGK